MRRRIITGLVILVVVGMFASGLAMVLVADSGDNPETTITLTMPQVVANDLIVRYGQGIEIVQGPVQAEKIYLSYLKDATHLRAILWVDGLMVEVASAPLATPAPATPTPAPATGE